MKKKQEGEAEYSNWGDNLKVTLVFVHNEMLTV